jgi:modification methylase
MKKETKAMNKLFTGHATAVMQQEIADASVDCVITSPSYWNATSDAWPTYEAFLGEMQTIWTQCARVLRPNAKLCINAPIMPIPKHVIGDQHTRHLKNIAFDIEHKILSETDLLRYSLFIWQKQTSKLMFGSYPQPGNIFENNTIEFINVFVKPGKPPRFDAARKDENKLTQDEWLDLIQQIWFMYPADVKRAGGHPAPYPEKLVGRLLRLYSYSGETVLDPFVGSGTTCAVAKKMGRRWIGIDIEERFVEMAQVRVEAAEVGEPVELRIGRPSWPTKDELAAAEGLDKVAAEKKYKRKSYGTKGNQNEAISKGKGQSDEHRRET